MKWWFVRWNPVTITMDEIAKVLEGQYLMCSEWSKAKNKHYHILFQSSITDAEELRCWCYDSFDLGTRKKGNPVLNVREVLNNDPEEVLKTGVYTVKDGKYIYSEWFSAHVEKLVANSYPKKSTEKEEVQMIIDDFLDGVLPYNWKKLWTTIAIAKASHMNFDPYKINKIVDSVRINYDSEYAELFYEKYMTI